MYNNNDLANIVNGNDLANVCDECGHRLYCNTYEIGVGKEQT